jgi:hypothetical protein
MLWEASSNRFLRTQHFSRCYNSHANVNLVCGRWPLPGQGAFTQRWASVFSHLAFHLRFHSSCKIFTFCLSSNLVVNYTLTLICILFLLLYDKVEVSAEPWIASLGGEFGLFEPYCRSWSTCGSHYGFMSFGTKCIRVQDHASSSHWQLTISSSHDLQQEIILCKVCIILIDWILLLWRRIMTSRLDFGPAFHCESKALLLQYGCHWCHESLHCLWIYKLQRLRLVLPQVLDSLSPTRLVLV